MTEFICGISREGRRARVLDVIRRSVDEKRKVYVISPEQQALLWDTLAAKELGASSALLVETLSFTRLADTLFRKYGGCAKNYITDDKKALLMWNAVSAVKGKLRVYGRGREDRFVSLMLKAVSEAKLYSKTPEELMRISETLSEEGREEGLSARLYDLALIWAAYESMMRESYDDPEEIPDALCALLDGHDAFSNTTVIIDSFYTLTPKEKNILRRIFASNARVYMTFDMAADDADGVHTEHIRQYRRSAASLAMRAGREYTVFEAKDSIGGPLGYLRENLWKYTAKKYEGDTSAVSMLGCGDRYDEAAVCAARISELVRGGASYAEIAVMAADMEKLTGVLDVHLETMDIPCYLSRKTDLLCQGAMRLILSAVSVIAGGWRREDVLAVSKTGLTNLSGDECDALEKYADKWRLRGKRAFVCDGWNMNALGYTDRVTEWGSELLALANSARDKLIPPLERFAASLSGTVEDACRGAFALISEFDVYRKIKKESARLRREGRGSEAQEKEQVWNAVCELLDTMVEVSGNTPVDAPRFAGLLRRCAAGVEIGTIPDGVDRVTLASATSARLEGIKHLIILGVIEGEFPMTPTDNGFFCERDKDVLGKMGVELSPGMDMKRSEELFRFLSAVSVPEETLTFIIPSRDGSESRSPSLGAMRVCRLLECEIKKDVHLDYVYLCQTETAARYYLPSVRDTEAGAAIARLLPEEEKEASVGFDHIPAETAKELFGKRMVMSQSKFEKFQDCPLSYYLRYVLRLDEGEVAKVSHVDVGNFVHKILEDILSEIKAEGNEYPFDEDRIKERTGELIGKYIGAVMPEGEADGRHSYIFSRVRRSFDVYLKSLNREFSSAAFKPEAFELSVGRRDSMVPALEVPLSDGGVMAMCGVVDRVDLYRGENNVYVRVADYKTGAKTFSLDRALEGRNIQLLLYLFSICAAENSEFAKKVCRNGEKLIPAGAVYFSAQPGQTGSPVPVNESEAEELTINEISRTGIALGEESIIRAMDPELTGRYSPVKIKANGEIGAGGKSRAEMDDIKDGLCDVMRRVGDKMRSGCAAAMPAQHDGKSPCTYCRMRPVCRIENTEGEEADHGN